MLTEEENIRLTQTGRGTEMGELLRRYWHPIAAATEFSEQSTKAVRIMGEDLVLYKDGSGTYGLLEIHCAHRSADLSYGVVEQCGLRCSYHGWAYDEEGRCIAQPFEDLGRETFPFRDSIRLVAYPVREMAGLLFAYLGPLPAPELPRWEPFDYKNGFAQIVLAPLNCNWLQATENNIDPVHFEWLHNNWSARQLGDSAFHAPTHLKIEVDEWEFGFGYKRILEGTTEADIVWAEPRLHLMPNIFLPGGEHFEFRVPIDDEHTLSLVWAWEAVPLEQQPFEQQSVPHWFAETVDPETGKWISTHVINQDTVAWVGQGVTTDRRKEHLGRSDIGVIRLRARLFDDLERVARGEDPSGLIRDPERAKLISWPDNRRARFEQARPYEEWAAVRARNDSPLRPDDYFAFYAGQPPAVRRAYEDAMGLPHREW